MSRKFLVEAGEPAGFCVADGETLCLQDSRYAVRVDWWTAAGDHGRGRVLERLSAVAGRHCPHPKSAGGTMKAFVGIRQVRLNVIESPLKCPGSGKSRNSNGAAIREFAADAQRAIRSQLGPAAPPYRP